ncbi:MAG: alpha/beta hydrolase, partial [Gammaproteobacteria bacterium]
EPTVIFDAGLGGFSLEWLTVQRELAGDAHSCAYDRAGYGFSEIGPGPRITSQIVDEFEYLLNVAQLTPPYILVGHSFGGYNMQYYAKQHPENVAALVLVDASHTEQAQRLSDATVQRRRIGKPRMVTMLANIDIIKKYPQDVQPYILALLGNRKALYTRENELANFTHSATEVNRAGALPILPLTVISRGKRVWSQDPLGDAREAQWKAMQSELAAQSPLGQHVIAEHSGHMVHLDEPYVIAQAIRALLTDATVRPAATVKPALTFRD